MTPPQLDNEIEKRLADIGRAERTVADARRAPNMSEYTAKALEELVTVVATERVFLAELRKYRASLL
jgi:hypothetical protein